MPLLFTALLCDYIGQHINNFDWGCKVWAEQAGADSPGMPFEPLRLHSGVTPSHLSGLWGCLSPHCSGIIPLSVKRSCVQLFIKLYVVCYTLHKWNHLEFSKSTENPSPYSSLFLLSHGSSRVGHWIIFPLMGRARGERAGVPGWIQIFLNTLLVYPVSPDRTTATTQPHIVHPALFQPCHLQG